MVFFTVTDAATEKILRQLSPGQVEFLAELADEFEPEPEEHGLTYLSSLPSSPGLELLAAAKKVNRTRRKLLPHEKEWNRELANEVPAAKKKKGQRLPAVLTVGEVRDYLGAAERNERDYLMLRLFYSAGLRLAEMDNLLVADLYFDVCRAFIRRGKGNKDRYVLIDPKTCDLLAKWCYSLKEDEQVFDLGRSQIARRAQQVAMRTGIYKRHKAMGRHFSTHSLRHSMATHLYEGGMDIFALQQLLGHTWVETTRGYVHIGVGLLMNHYQSAHPLCREPHGD